MAENNTIKTVVDLINNGKKYPAVSLVKKDPELAATLSKLVKSRIPSLLKFDENTTTSNINRQNLQEISQSIAERTTDSQTILELFPEIELSQQILISSIISPKDMTSSEIIYTATHCLLPADVIASCINRIKEFDEKEYKLRKLLPDILREVLFETGSHVRAIIPESSIDQIINGEQRIGNESLSNLVDDKGFPKSFGILGNVEKTESKDTKYISLESFTNYNSAPDYKSEIEFKDKGGRKISLEGLGRVIVTDNPDIFKIPKVFERAKKDKIKDIYSKGNGSKNLAFESHGANGKKFTESQIEALFYKTKHNKSKDFLYIKPQSSLVRNTVGKPLVMKIPSEAVIPVFIPGNNKTHIGFFVLMDIEGNPINKDNSNSHFDSLQGQLANNSNTMSHMLLDKANTGLTKVNSKALNVDQASKIYADIVETDLMNRLRNGIYGHNVDIGKNDEVYRIMLARTFANQSTQLVYIPAELVTYFAYKYDANGIGKSLLDDMRVLNSLRGMMMFARVMAAVKNSIGRTEVKLKLDELDPDPQKTIELAVHEIAKTRQQYFPLGINSPVDIVDWIQKAGFEFTFEGHPRIPDMNIQFNEKATNYQKPDQDLDDELKKRSIQGLGLSPETVDNGFSAEFATTVVSNNLLLAKRVIQIQDEITPHLTDYFQKIIKNDGNIIDALKGIIRENLIKVKELLTDDEKATFDKEGSDEEITDFVFLNFVSTLELTLPQPNSITLDNQMEAFNKYSEALDKALEAWVSADLINSNMSGDISNNVENIVKIVKAYYMRKWMTDNNCLPELADLTTADEDGNPMVNIMEIQAAHIESLTKSFVHLLQKTKPMADAANTDLAAITGGDGLDASAGGGDTPPDDGGSSDGMGGDDMGLDLDTGSDETPPADDTNPEDDTTQSDEEELKK